MNFTGCRFCIPFFVAFILLAIGHSAFAEPATSTTGTVPPGGPNLLRNGGYECGAVGYYAIDPPPGQSKPNMVPTGWQFTTTVTPPILSSARIRILKACDAGGEIEKLEGKDSVIVRSLDIETPPEPGKPFDMSLVQQVGVVSGTAYSVSGWMVTFCGGSNTEPRNDCPEGYFMAKMLGIDPLGGLDPDAPSIEWVESRANFVGPDGRTFVGWQNLRSVSVARAPTVTVFARINSPFRWHGNFGHMDAMSMVQAPTATLRVITETTKPISMTVSWDGDLGPNIPLISGGNFKLYFDVQYWHEQNGAWQDIVTDARDQHSAEFTAACPGSIYRFRARARAEQPPGEGGIFPTQRYPGPWTAPIEVLVPSLSAAQISVTQGSERLYLPLVRRPGPC